MARLLRRTALASLMAMAMMAIAAPAFAHHKPDHAGGPASSSSTTVVTEDNDSDGMPNTPDPAGDTDNAHPSGNDKSAESGGSGNQGSSESTPDQNGNGPERDHEGTDKPGGAGGVDKLDQDGNNGCGNDDDFEDDNEGNCGGKAKTKPPKTPKPPKDDTPKGNDNPKPPKDDDDDTPVVPSGNPTVTPPTIVSDAGTSSAGSPDDVPAPSGPEAAPAVVVSDGELAFTGVDITSFLIVTILLGLAGLGFVLAGRRSSKA